MLIDIKTILEIETIAMENPEGFTLFIPTRELIQTGIAVGHAATQNEFGRSGIHACIKHSLYNYGHLGGWRNPDGRMQYDSVRIFTDLQKAIKYGRKQKQYSIFDLDNGWEIIL